MFPDLKKLHPIRAPLTEGTAKALSKLVSPCREGATSAGFHDVPDNGSLGQGCCKVSMKPASIAMLSALALIVPAHAHENAELIEEVRQLQNELRIVKQQHRELKREIEALRQQSQQQLQVSDTAPAGSTSRVSVTPPSRSTPVVVSAPLSTTVLPPVLPPAVAEPAKPLPVARPPAKKDAALPEEREAYTNAMLHLEQGRISALRSELLGFIDQYRGGIYEVEAYYWIAESYFEEGDYQRAMPYYKNIIRNFPDNTRHDGAELKLSYIYYDTEQWDKARALLEGLLESDDDRIARLARKRLDRMAEEQR